MGLYKNPRLNTQQKTLCTKSSEAYKQKSFV